MRAAADFLAHGLADLGHPIADHPDRWRVVVVVVDLAAGCPPVPGPAGLAELLAPVEHPGPRKVPLLHRPGQPELPGPDVPDRGEPPSQHPSKRTAGPRRDINGR